MRALFPADVFETLQEHALERYGLTELLEDPKTLDGLEPNPALLKVLARVHGRAQPAVEARLRAISDEIIADLVRRLKAQVEYAFSGSRDRTRRSSLASAANFDWRSTVRANLKGWDAERERLIAEDLRFVSRTRRRLPWHVVLCVDQSGSMTDSLVHAAVMAAILSGLPGVRVRMVLFDTSILDVSDRLTDPLETLLSVQLGGGTDIGRAVRYAETLIDDPSRTVLAHLALRGEDAAKVDANGVSVEIDGGGVAAARCDCPASGVCRHVLMAVLLLREAAGDGGSGAARTSADAGVIDAEPSGTRSAREELLALSSSTLRTFAGKIGLSCWDRFRTYTDSPDFPNEYVAGTVAIDIDAVALTEVFGKFREIAFVLRGEFR